MHRSRPAAMLILWLGFLACEGSSLAAAPLSDVDIARLMEKGMADVSRGNPETAIRTAYDPVIQNFETLYARERRKVYSARTGTEAIYYMVMSATVGDGNSGRTKGAVVANGAWSEAHWMKGYALVELERFDEAKVALRRALELSPLFPSVWSELGALYQLDKNWPDALKAYQEAEEGAKMIYPAGPEQTDRLTRALRGQGYVLIETDKLDEAEARYRRVLELVPDEPGAKRELTYIANLRKQRAAEASN